MRIVMLAYGTSGDMRPYVVLAQALQREGFDVLVLAAEEFREWVEARGLVFVGLEVNVQEILDSMLNASGNEDAGNNFIVSALTYRKKIAWAMTLLGEAVVDVVREGDALIYVETGQSVLNGVIEKYHLHPIIVSLFPTIPTTQFPVFNIPESPAWMPARSWYNRLSGSVLRRATWQIVGGVGNKIRREQLGLSRIGWRKHRRLLRETPQILLISPHVLPPPLDWSHIHMTGYLFDDDPTWQPSEDLLDFLDDGEKPVYIGLGSMTVKDPKALTHLFVDALQQVGKRAVLYSGKVGIGDIDLPETIFQIDYAPHSWLFPRMSVVVHHGGAGTTAAGLRAGVPTIIIPLLGDQLFWGRRVYELGAGTQPLTQNKLTASNLASAIYEVTDSPRTRERALELSQLIQAEDGIGNAVKTISELLNVSLTSTVHHES